MLDTVIPFNIPGHPHRVLGRSAHVFPENYFRIARYKGISLTDISTRFMIDFFGEAKNHSVCVICFIVCASS
jgi:hypothetical protein